MNEKLQQLLDEYEENYNEFTYLHYLDKDNQFALKTGLVGCFYLNQAYLPEKRQALGKALALYDKYWGNKLHYGFSDGDPNQIIPYEKMNIIEKQNEIISNGYDSLNFYWSNVNNLNFTPAYMIKTMSFADWFEEVHKPISYLQFYLPISELITLGCEKMIELIKEMSQLLQPMHGFFGLGVQHSHEFYGYQHLEYEIAHKYFGLDISNDESDLRFRKGFKCINWLTILGDELINAKLGSITELKNNNHDEAIEFYPYHGGIIVRAGEVPELAKVEHKPYPKHYVNVNALLKPARAPDIGSLGFGSINGVIRFNNRTSKIWQARFDDIIPSDIPAESVNNINATTEKQRVRIQVKSGELCRYSGLYSASIDGKIEHRELSLGHIVAPFRNSETGKIYDDVIWHLLRRDDGGEVYLK